MPSDAFSRRSHEVFHDFSHTVSSKFVPIQTWYLDVLRFASWNILLFSLPNALSFLFFSGYSFCHSHNLVHLLYPFLHACLRAKCLWNRKSTLSAFHEVGYLVENVAECYIRLSFPQLGNINNKHVQFSAGILVIKLIAFHWYGQLQHIYHNTRIHAWGGQPLSTTFSLTSKILCFSAK